MSIMSTGVGYHMEKIKEKITTISYNSYRMRELVVYILNKNARID